MDLSFKQERPAAQSSTSTTIRPQERFHHTKKISLEIVSMGRVDFSCLGGGLYRLGKASPPNFHRIVFCTGDSPRPLLDSPHTPATAEAQYTTNRNNNPPHTHPCPHGPVPAPTQPHKRRPIRQRFREERLGRTNCHLRGSFIIIRDLIIHHKPDKTTRTAATHSAKYTPCCWLNFSPPLSPGGGPGAPGLLAARLPDCESSEPLPASLS